MSHLLSTSLLFKVSNIACDRKQCKKTTRVDIRLMGEDDLSLMSANRFDVSRSDRKIQINGFSSAGEYGAAMIVMN